jgi:hypothetical protein
MPSKKLVRHAAECETTLGIGSLFNNSISCGKITSPYFYWNFGCISSEICPIAWQAAYLSIGFEFFKKPTIIIKTEYILSTS